MSLVLRVGGRAVLLGLLRHICESEVNNVNLGIWPHLAVTVRERSASGGGMRLKPCKALLAPACCVPHHALIVKLCFQVVRQTARPSTAPSFLPAACCVAAPLPDG